MTAGEITISNHRNSVLLNEHGDGLRLIREGLRQDFLMETGPLLIWRLFFQGEAVSCPDWRLDSLEASDQSAALKGRCNNSLIRLQVSLDNYGCKWQVRLKNLSEKAVDALEFELRPPSSLESDLLCTFPFCAGWAIPMASLKPGDRFSLHYPVQASMQWISLYNQEQGIYFGVHDEAPLYKTLIVGQEGGTPFIRWRLSDLALSSGEEMDFPPVYLAGHTDSWRGAARIYQSWASQFISAPDVPLWLEKNPSWAWVGLKGQLAEKPWHNITYLPGFSDQVAASGVDLIQLTAYTEHGHDTLYPDYLPGLSMGGEVALRAAVGTIHRKGRRISIYVNGRVVDPSSSIDAKKRQDWAVRTQHEAPPHTERYGEISFDIMCPGAGEWRDLFAEKLAYLVRNFDMDGIYIDQVCGCTSLPCYATGHDHQKPNQAWSYYKTFLADLRSRLLSIKPDLFLATEGVNDIFGQYFDLQQAHHDWSGPLGDTGVPLPDLYRYTFPKHLLAGGCITGENHDLHYLKVSHLTGIGFDFGVWDWAELPDAFTWQVKAVLEWRRKHFRPLRTAEIVPVECSCSGFQANAFYSDVSIVVCGARVNWEDTQQSVVGVILQVPIPAGKKISGVHWMTPGPPGAWGEDGNRAILQMHPAEFLGAALKLSRDDA